LTLISIVYAAFISSRLMADSILLHLSSVEDATY
jgi:hypothetical protein